MTERQSTPAVPLAWSGDCDMNCPRGIETTRAPTRLRRPTISLKMKKGPSSPGPWKVRTLCCRWRVQTCRTATLSIYSTETCKTTPGWRGTSVASAVPRGDRADREWMRQSSPARLRGPRATEHAFGNAFIERMTALDGGPFRERKSARHDATIATQALARRTPDFWCNVGNSRRFRLEPRRRNSVCRGRMPKRISLRTPLIGG